MNFSIDSILMTLLVGVVATLSATAFIFLFLAPSLRLPALERLFRFLLWEDKPFNASGKPPPVASISQNDGLFHGLLLIACTFGLGVAVEIASDNFNGGDTASSVRAVLGVPHDTSIRLDSFSKVAEGEIYSGRPNENLRRLYTDYIACRRVLEPDGDDPIPAEVETTSYEPCSIVLQRVSELYYHAKNNDFAKETYFHELKDMQARIDFVRSLAFILLVLAVILAAGLAIALLAEAVEFMVDRKTRWFKPRQVRWWRSQLRSGDGFISHVKNLSELRLAFLMVVAFVAGWSSLRAWWGLEKGYDNRVFGYFICERCMDGPALISSDGTNGNPAQGQDQRIPDSIFRVFSSPSGHFEPSALASIGLVEGRNLFVVANDKDSDNLYLFELNRQGELRFLHYLPIDRG